MNLVNARLPHNSDQVFPRAEKITIAVPKLDALTKTSYKPIKPNKVRVPKIT